MVGSETSSESTYFVRCDSIWSKLLWQIDIESFLGKNFPFVSMELILNRQSSNVEFINLSSPG